MSDTKTIATQRAENLLKAAGVEYAIRLEDGTLLGTLTIAAPPPPRGGHKKLNNFVRDLDYITAMRQLPPGGTLSWDTTSHPLAVSLQKVVAAAGNRLWGKESYITTQVNGGNGVEVLRVI